MADKARYFLEQSIPELKEFEKKKIFTKEEIAAITKKRSEFEHKVNIPGCKPVDYARYVEYEMNLEALRKKRVQRLGLKGRSYTGSRKIFFILDRATRKFHGDIGLWMQYIDFAKKEKASKVLLKVFASALKLHPMKTELWIYAARHAMEENGDMTEARSFMQRGLRFNKGSKLLWLEYTKLELVYIAKIITRRRLLGIDQQEELPSNKTNDNDEEMIELPAITGEDLSHEGSEEDKLENSPLNSLEDNPAFNGAIPLAVFDSAIKEIPNDIEFIFSFFNLFASFTGLPCQRKLVTHSVNCALKDFPTTSLTLFMEIKALFVGTEVIDPKFPSTLGHALSKIMDSISNATPRTEFYQHITSFLLDLLKQKDLDPAMETVIKGALNKYFKQAEQDGDINGDMYLAWSRLLHSSGKERAGQVVLKRGLEAFPNIAIEAK
ncbi:half-A-TPR repeat-containing protein [Kalaharituber pfeilii]|nr:half-A-TPR repeat-containing protein [Kalaharituber pfeilii]